MDKYDEMSSFELSMRVARVLGLDLCEGQNYKPEVAYWGSHGHLTTFSIENPADMWPIIIDNDITVSPSEGAWLHDCRSHGYNNDSYDMGKIYESNDNPLRAAAIVFLMIQENSDGNSKG